MTEHQKHQESHCHHATGVFMGFEAKPIGKDISWAVIAIVAALTVISVGLLYATAFVDPGFVPRDLEEDAAEEG